MPVVTGLAGLTLVLLPFLLGDLLNGMTFMVAAAKFCLVWLPAALVYLALIAIFLL